MGLLEEVQSFYLHLSTLFSQYFLEQLEKIPDYEANELSDFEPETSKFLEDVKANIPNSKKATEVLIKKFKTNDKVWVHDDKMEIYLGKTDKPTQYIINTGVVFMINSNQTLCITASHESVKMNPIFLDKTTSMPVILNISTDGSQHKVILDVTLFSNSNGKYKVNDNQENLEKGTIKNFKVDSIMEVINITLSKSFANVNNTKFDLKPGTAVLIAQRKRNHKIFQTSLIGIMKKKSDGEYVADFRTDTDTFLANYSYTVVHGYYSKLTIVEIEKMNDPWVTKNCGYNGWFAFTDSQYEKVVVLYKNMGKMVKLLNTVQQVLKVKNWNTDENIEYIKNNCSKKNLKQIQVQACATDIQEFEEFMKTINLASGHQPIAMLIKTDEDELQAIIEKRNETIKHFQDLDYDDTCTTGDEANENCNLLDGECEDTSDECTSESEDTDDNEEELDVETQELEPQSTEMEENNTSNAKRTHEDEEQESDDDEPSKKRKEYIINKIYKPA